MPAVARLCMKLPARTNASRDVDCATQHGRPLTEPSMHHGQMQLCASADQQHSQQGACLPLQVIVDGSTSVLCMSKCTQRFPNAGCRWHHTTCRRLVTYGRRCAIQRTSI